MAWKQYAYSKHRRGMLSSIAAFYTWPLIFKTTGTAGVIMQHDRSWVIMAWLADCRYLHFYWTQVTVSVSVPIENGNIDLPQMVTWWNDYL